MKLKVPNLILLAIAAIGINFSCISSKDESGVPTRKSTIIDSARMVTLDGNSGKRFDILTGKSTGIHFINDLTDNFQINDFRYLYMFNGGGVNIGDINKDGLPDLFFVGNANSSPCKLYLNKGNLQFEDIT